MRKYSLPSAKSRSQLRKRLGVGAEIAIEPVQLLAERIFEPWDGVEEGSVVLEHRAGIFVLRCQLVAPDPFEGAADGVLVEDP